LSFANSGLFPPTLLSGIAAQAPAFHAWAHKVAAHPSVTGIYDEANVLKKTRERAEKLRAAA
jgi:hypothetical protein